ncbi:serine/threonine protein kinase [Actinoplanes sp. ATCC 53533]|uniref:serine/threonine-protein kinase n=1 Tax=Actinoplanes sp. ATCC 53533 TaxID=1288362 RepID=UPI000F7AD142|nr:serine/threonine-protein kinase [Actinoplanes sp. ATCC 53533]RSM58080.1 serine/threonine protein kinase [Actinoplanes sp. ATCC 53533]
MSDDWPAAGTILAFRYRLVCRLETGGMAEIWHAQDELLARPVALKLPTGLDRARTDVLQLAWREARMGARLSHPNIAAVHDYDEAVRPDGSVAPFVVMELLTGETLAARLARAPLPWPEAAAIGAAVAGALIAAHASGVVHRDVKPGNVMLTPTGVKILDFGISAVTGEPDDDETGATFGTPAYVAPERLDGKPAEPATDVYGLGVLLFEMLTGQPPYPVDTWEELAAARAGGAPGLPSTLPPALRELVRRCLVDEPERRPTAVAVGDGLTDLVTPPPPAARQPALNPAVGVAYPAHNPPTGTGHPAHNPAARATQPTQSPAAWPAQPTQDPPTGTGHPARDPADGGGPVRGSAPGSGGGARPGSRRRRLVLWSSLVALAVSALALFAALGSSRPTVEAGRSPAATPPPSSPPLSSPPSSPPATATPRTALRTAEPLDVDVALARVRSAVEAGRDEGQIRPDVAVDLLNLLRPLGRADPGEADDQVAELRRKLRDRVDEGSVDGARGEVLLSRLADLHAALSSG